MPCVRDLSRQTRLLATNWRAVRKRAPGESTSARAFTHGEPKPSQTLLRHNHDRTPRAPDAEVGRWKPHHDGDGDRIYYSTGAQNCDRSGPDAAAFGEVHSGTLHAGTVIRTRVRLPESRCSTRTWHQQKTRPETRWVPDFCTNFTRAVMQYQSMSSGLLTDSVGEHPGDTQSLDRSH